MADKGLLDTHEHEVFDVEAAHLSDTESRPAESQSLAVRAAIVHVIGDIVQSVGVCIAAALIWSFSDRWPDQNGISYWYRLDPVCTIGFSGLVLMTSISTVQDAMHVLMAGVPSGVDLKSITQQLLSIPDVVEVHDVHVWALSSDKLNMWAHLTVAPCTASTPVLYEAQRIARSIGCNHTCFQIEDTSTYDKDQCGHDCFHTGPIERDS